MEDINAEDLTPETSQTLDGSEQIVMFDAVEGKRGDIDTVGAYILQHNDADGNGNTIGQLLSNKTDKSTTGDLQDLDTTDKASIVDAINEVKNDANTNAKNISLIPVDNSEKDCFGIYRQRICKFYDVFYRDDTTGFGDNGETMAWDTELESYAAIQDHKLVITNTPGGRPVLTNIASTGDDFAAEVAIDNGYTGYTGIALCVENATNFLYLRIEVTSASRISVRLYKNENGTYTQLADKILTVPVTPYHIVTAHYQSGKIYIYVDGEFYLESEAKVSWTGRKIGVIGLRNTTLRYASFSVFTFRDFLEYNVKNIDRGQRNTLTAIIPDGTQNYSIIDSTKSPKAENFYLYRDAVTTNANARTEVRYRDDFNELPLAHLTAEWDEKFDDPFVPDTIYKEVIFQFHGRNSLSPCIAVNVDGNTLLLRNVGSSIRNLDYYPDATVTTIGTITPGWHHFKLDIYLGCSDYHQPRIDAYVDGEYRGTSLTPNQYCEDLGPWLQYGIYKWDWEDHKDGDVSERHYIIDNVKLIY